MNNANYINNNKYNELNEYTTYYPKINIISKLYSIYQNLKQNILISK